MTIGSSFSITVATGGAGSSVGCPNGTASGRGNTSSIGAIISAAGGFGAPNSTSNALGGASGNSNAAGQPTFDNTGNCTLNGCASGGGGGAGGVGGTGATNGGNSVAGMNGGPGVSSSITGTSISYGGGGAGANARSGFMYGRSDPLAGGATQCAAVANSGAGGSDCLNSNGGLGGSGVVYIRYTPITPVTLSTPSAPTVSATSNTLKSISVSWSAIANVSSYTLKLYNSSSSLLVTSGLTGLTGTSATITTSNLASLADNTAYKVSITAIGNGSSYLDSSESTKSDVTTNAAPGSPTITVQPTAQSSTFGATATFSVTATSPDSGSLGYQWQVSTDSGGTWNNAPTGSGATTNSYTTATLAMAASGYRYRVNVTNTKNGATSTAVTSSAVTLTVNKADQATLSFTINVSSKTSPYSQAVTFTPSGGTGDGATTYAIVSGGSATSCALANNTASNTITATTSGTCLIQATKAADTNYLVTTSSNVTFTFNKANQSALSITSTSGTFGATLTLTTSGGSSGGLVTFVVDSGNCSVSSATLSNTSAGD